MGTIITIAGILFTLYAVGVKRSPVVTQRKPVSSGAASTVGSTLVHNVDGPLGFISLAGDVPPQLIDPIALGVPESPDPVIDISPKAFLIDHPGPAQRERGPAEAYVAPTGPAITVSSPSVISPLPMVTGGGDSFVDDVYSPYDSSSLNKGERDLDVFSL